MARRKLEDRHIRNLTKIAGGKSYAITIPIDYIKKLGWKERQKLVVHLYKDRITIREWKP